MTSAGCDCGCACGTTAAVVDWLATGLTTATGWLASGSAEATGTARTATLAISTAARAPSTARRTIGGVTRSDSSRSDSTQLAPRDADSATLTTTRSTMLRT